MRRARSKLQVSTFPFLAVLLAAMGALIFLLLVMDCRAKLVARNKAQEALASKKKAQTDTDAESLLAWQREQDEQRAQADVEQKLAAQKKLLDAELSKVTSDLTRAAEAAKKEEAEAARLRLEEQSLRKFLADAARELDAKTLARNLSKEQEEAARASLAKMAHELSQLEKVLENLKNRSKRDNVYAVVPYRGKYGENRKPIYLECDARGVLLHPSGTRLLDLSPERLRQALQDAGLTLTAKKETLPVAATEKTGPYVMCLVRPNGIGTYERVMQAFAGLDIDFGYELVDAEWVLDFSKEAVAAAAAELPKAAVRPPVAKGGAPVRVELPGKEGGVSGMPGTKSPATLFPPLPGAGPKPDGKQGIPWRGSKGDGKGGDKDGAKAPLTSPEGKSGGAPPEDPGPREGGFAGPLAKATPRPPSLGHLLANRDFVIHIACAETEAVLKLNGERFATDGNAMDQARSAAALADGVRGLIARRQASVRPGETPYRPLIRFQVQPGGLRTYYLIYPVLAGLRVPMSRENIE